jgi:small GTP-binding protein
MTGSKISKKICLVGDFGVGKTSLVRRFVDGSFSDLYLTTVGVKISRKLVQLDRPLESIQLLIWDLEGSSKFKGISATHLQGASGAIIVADLSRIETVKNIEDHIITFLTINPKGSIIIALNKTDLVASEVAESSLQAIAQIQETSVFNHLHPFLGAYLTSAKTDVSVNEIFAKLADKITT